MPLPGRCGGSAVAALSAVLRRAGGRTGGAAPAGAGYVTGGVSGGPVPRPLSAVARWEEGLPLGAPVAAFPEPGGGCAPSALPRTGAAPARGRARAHPQSEPLPAPKGVASRKLQSLGSARCPRLGAERTNPDSESCCVRAAAAQKHRAVPSVQAKGHASNGYFLLDLFLLGWVRLISYPW